MPHVLTPILGCAWAAILAATIAAQTAGDPAAKKMKNPVAATPDSIKEGQQLFQKYCRFCHGADAKGNGPMAPKGTHPPDLTDAEWTTGSSDGEIFAVIRDGTGPKQEMKPFKSKMTAQEMWHVVNYLRSIGPKTKQP